MVGRRGAVHLLKGFSRVSRGRGRVVVLHWRAPWKPMTVLIAIRAGQQEGKNTATVSLAILLTAEVEVFTSRVLAACMRSLVQHSAVEQQTTQRERTTTPLASTDAPQTGPSLQAFQGATRTLLSFGSEHEHFTRCCYKYCRCRNEIPMQIGISSAAAVSVRPHHRHHHRSRAHGKALD